MDAPATARLLADVLTAEWGAGPGPERLVVLDDGRGLSELLSDRFAPTQMRVHSDRISVEEELRTRLHGRSGVEISPRLEADTFAGADLVALDLPASRAALDQIARLAASQGCGLLLGVGRDRHMNPTMNATLARSFAEVHASRGRQKSRVLVARDPLPTTDSSDLPRHRRLDDLDLDVCAFGGAFAGTRLDAGTRLLLSTLDQWRLAERIVDLGCGTGVLAALAARANPSAQVVAIDESATACRSAEATATANGLGAQISVRRGDGLSGQPDHSAELIVCNPPFHVGTAKESTPAVRMLTDAGRVLVPGGELWTVHNSHLPYRAVLRREVGRTELVVQDRGYQVLRTRS